LASSITLPFLTRPLCLFSLAPFQKLIVSFQKKRSLFLAAASPAAVMALYEKRRVCPLVGASLLDDIPSHTRVER